MVFTERRKYKRFEVDCKVTISSIEDKNTVYEVNVLDIGGGGISFSSNHNFDKGTSFIIQLPFVSLPIYIIWHQEDKYGAMFTHPLADEAEIIAHSICEGKYGASKKTES